MVTEAKFRARKLASALTGSKLRSVLVPLFTIVALGMLVVLAGITGAATSGPRGKDMLPELERAFEAIRPPPDARLVRPPSSASKMTNALVDASYQSNLGCDALRSHYDAEASRQGWSACGERQVRDWFRDLGGMARDYCKGDLRAELQYAGSRAGYGWTFAFSVSWGLN